MRLKMRMFCKDDRCDGWGWLMPAIEMAGYKMIDVDWALLLNISRFSRNMIWVNRICWGAVCEFPDADVLQR